MPGLKCAIRALSVTAFSVVVACGGGVDSDPEAGGSSSVPVDGAGSGAGDGGGQSGDGSTPAPSWALGITAVAQRGLRLEWPQVPGATSYEIARDADSTDGANSFITLGTIDNGAQTTHTFTNLRLVDALRHIYRVRACVASDCSKSATAEVTGTLHEAANVIVGNGTTDAQGFGRVMSTASANVPSASGANVRLHWLAVGVPGAGKVMVYQRRANSSDWGLVTSLSNTASDSEGFGSSLAFSPNGNWLAVGVPGDSQDGAGVDPVVSGSSLRDSGAVRVYRRTSPAAGQYTWTPFAYVKAINPGVGDRFGAAVSINDSGFLVVGAPFEDGASLDSHPADAPAAVFVDASDGSRDHGAVYAYRISPTTPPGSVALCYLKPRALTSGDVSGALFGSTVALSNTGQLAVGAPHASLRAANAGAVLGYHLNSSTGLLFYQATIGPPPDQSAGTPTNLGFGASVSLNDDGTMLAVGYPGWSNGPHGDKAGAAYVYERVGFPLGADLEWRQMASFASPTPYALNRFGMSVQLMTTQFVFGQEARTMLLIGSWGDSAQHLGLERSGAFSPSSNSGQYRDTGGAFFYEWLNGAWTVRARLKGPSLMRDQRMGRSVVVTRDGEELLMGAEGATVVVGY